MAEPVDPVREITLLLHEWRNGSAAAENQLFELVTPNLRKLAHYLMSKERNDRSLQATELVNEAYLRLITAKDRDWQDRKHFFAIAARVMRRYLIDQARKGKAAFVPIDPDQSDPGALPPEDAILLDQLLDELSHEKPEWCTVVEMKYFLGFTDEEAARETGLALRSLQRMWLDARKWLHARMEPRDA